ncbi:RNA-guided endonuclease InsQ/TnpB family protein [Paenibacillus tarimensis]
MPTITIKMPLFEPSNAKQQMYGNMQQLFSSAANNVLFLKRHYLLSISQIEQHLSHYGLPSTLVQEARKLAISRFADWRKHQKTKGFPLFKNRISILFNNQNWRLRFDNEYLKVGIPTIEPGTLTAEKYVPVKTNDYSLFWAYALSGQIDTTSKHYISGMHSLKKGNAQLFFKNRQWFFACTVSFEVEATVPEGRAVGVDRGLRLIAACGEPQSGSYLTFSGKSIGHIRRKFYRLRRALQRAKNIKAMKRLEHKERRITCHTNHMISKQIVQFALDCRASLIKLEDLSGIRNMKKFWKRSDRNIHSWAFYDLAAKIEYKALKRGIAVGYVDPFKTSQECHACGKVAKSNRRKHEYKCSCGYHENADVNASFVISERPSK